MDKKKIKRFIIRAIKLITNPRFLLCFGLAWLITNGWAYIALGLATIFKSGWLATIAGAYLALLWLPFTPEKIITLMLSIILLKRLFPDDQKTLAVLKRLYDNLKTKAKEKRARRRAKKVNGKGKFKKKIQDNPK